MSPTWTIREYAPEDAAGVAAMWNASDQLWPGGFTGGVPFTAESVRRNEERSTKLALLLAVADGEVAGYCRVTEYAAEPDAAYVALLNVAPQYHKQGFGRELLKRSLELAMQRGYRRLDLHTWPGNMRAVPLYKKTGFFWVPETSVHMENFLPLILRQPLLADFFAQHDWYQTQVRDLSVQEDDVRVGGMRIYPYEWKADGQQVRAVIDAVSGRLTELATDAWRVACTVDDRRLYPGFSRRVRWTVERRQGPPLEVTLSGRGSPGLHLQREYAATVDERVEWEAELTADLDLKARQEHEPPHGVETTLVQNGRLLHLTTAVQVVKPLGVQLVGMQPLTPGVRQVVDLRLRNQQEAAVRGDVTFVPSVGLAVEAPEGGALAPLAVDVEGESYTGTRLALTPRQAGLAWLRVQPRLGSGDDLPRWLAPVDLPLPGLDAGGAIAYVHEDVVHLQTATSSCAVRLRSGGWSLQDRLSNKAVIEGQVIAGSPPNRTLYQRVTYTATMSEEPGAAVAVLRGSPPELPAVTLELCFRLDTANMLTVQAQAQYSGDGAQPLEVRFQAWPRLVRRQRVAAPLASGIVVDEALEWPDWQRDERFERPDFLGESWFAAEDEGGRVAGALWSGGDPVEVEGWGFPRITYKLTGLTLGGSIDVATLRYFGGPGSWETVRAFYRRLIDPTVSEDLPPARRALEVTSAWPPGLRPGESALRLRSLYVRQQHATLELDMPKGWSSEQTRLPVGPLPFDEAVDVPLTLRRTEQRPSAALLGAHYRGEFLEQHFQVPLLDLGDGPGVQVEAMLHEGRDAFTVDNGLLHAVVVPSFSGSIVSLRTKGRQRLASAFPEAREFTWMRPWHGGLLSLLRLEGWGWFPDAGRLYEEQFTAEPVRSQGPSRRWAGVRIQVTPRDRRLRGLALACDYVIAPGSNVLAVVLTVTNLTTARLEPSCGFALFQPGERAYRVLGPGGPEQRLQTTSYSTGISREGWTATAEADGTALVVASTEPRLTAHAHGSIPDGVYVGVDGRIRLDPGTTRTVRTYAAFCRDDEIPAYGCLAGAVELP